MHMQVGSVPLLCQKSPLQRLAPHLHLAVRAEGYCPCQQWSPPALPCSLNEGTQHFGSCTGPAPQQKSSGYSLGALQQRWRQYMLPGDSRKVKAVLYKLAVFELSRFRLTGHSKLLRYRSDRERCGFEVRM